MDPLRIGQVLNNLLDNAVKYTQGNIEITFADMPTIIRVSIRDHGIGIPKEELAMLFTPFVRGSFENGL